MIKNLLIKRFEIIWIVFHMILGVVSTFTPYFLVFWVLTIMASSFLGLLLNRNRDGIMTMTLFYLMGVEVFSRMSRAPLTHLLPDEIGKYFPLFVLLATFLLEGKMRKGGIGWWIILLTIPSLFLIESWNLRYGIIFNYLGIFNLALLILYFSEKTIDLAFLNNLFKLTLFPIISIGTFLFIKVPDFDEIEFYLGQASNFDTSGGYGPNQVSTALGIGIFILGYFILTKQKLFALKFLDEALIVFFGIRALLTFSRGGVMVPILCLLVMYGLIYMNKKRASSLQLKKIKLSYLIMILFGGASVFLYANSVSNGSLLSRYEGKSAGTIAGTKEIDLNHYTSNRVELMEIDFMLFINNPLAGVGPGMSKFSEGHLGLGSHSEFSRLLAEHGLFGLIVVLILIIYPLIYYKRINNPLQKGLFVAFILLSILTSFHAAMRTMVTPMFYGLAFAKFKLT